MTKYKSFKSALEEVATYKKSDLDKYKSVASTLNEMKKTQSQITTSDDPHSEEKKKKKAAKAEEKIADQNSYTDHSHEVSDVKEHVQFAHSAMTKLSESFIWRKNAGKIADHLLEMLDEGKLSTKQPMNECILAAYESLKSKGKLK